MHFTDGNVLSMINEKAEDQPKIQDSDLYKTGMDRKANKNKSCEQKDTRIGGEERCIQQKKNPLAPKQIAKRPQTGYNRSNEHPAGCGSTGRAA
jgi:hypothetical protein